MLHQIKAPQFYTDLGLQKTVLNPLVNGKFEDFSRPLDVFQVLFTANRGQKFHLSPRIDEWILERTSDSSQSARPTGRVLKSAGETSIF